MTDKDLCDWLRNNSSGVYRPSAEAANRIENLLEWIEKEAPINDTCTKNITGLICKRCVCGKAKS